MVKRKRKTQRRRKPLNRLMNTTVDAVRLGVVAGVGFGIVRGVNDAF